MGKLKPSLLLFPTIFFWDKEAYYHTVIYLIPRLSGAGVRCEDPTNIGRIDAVLETAKKIYIMEFKVGSEQDALDQIKKMKYDEKYRGKGKEIVLLGIGRIWCRINFTSLRVPPLDSRGDLKAPFGRF